MNDRQRSCHHQQQQLQHTRQIFDKKCRTLNNDLRKTNDTIESLR